MSEISEYSVGETLMVSSEKFLPEIKDCFEWVKINEYDYPDMQVTIHVEEYEVRIKQLEFDFE